MVLYYNSLHGHLSCFLGDLCRHIIYCQTNIKIYSLLGSTCFFFQEKMFRYHVMSLSQIRISNKVRTFLNWKTINLLTCSDSSTNTKMDRNRPKKEEKRNVKSQVSGVTCHVSRVTCHLSLTPIATASDQPSAFSPIMHSRLVCTDPLQNFKTKNY